MSKSKLVAIIVGILIISIVSYYYYYNYYSINLQPPQKYPVIKTEKKDIFGISEIYPTKKGGRVWYINMENPLSDPLFSITSDIPITKSKNGDESWFINNSQIRININTIDDEPQWKNIEMTGYIKVDSINKTSQSDKKNSDSTDSSLSPAITWRARGGSHNDRSPCEGTALNGGLNILDKTAAWKKEIWHTGGYTDSRGETVATEKSLIGRWIGWKIVMYNLSNDTAVKMESYIDDNNSNKWKKVNEVLDDGGWYANSSDEDFYSTNCNKPKDYIITNGGPIATFRADNMAFDFKNLSIREIQT